MTGVKGICWLQSGGLWVEGGACGREISIPGKASVVARRQDARKGVRRAGSQVPGSAHADYCSSRCVLPMLPAPGLPTILSSFRLARFFRGNGCGRGCDVARGSPAPGG